MKELVNELSQLKYEEIELTERWESLLNKMKEAFKRKYGVVLPFISLRDLGINSDYDSYLKDKKYVQDKIKKKMQSAIREIAQIADYNTPLIDYRIEFDLNEYVYRTPTTLEQVLDYLVNFDNEIGLYKRLNLLLNEHIFFTVENVVVEKNEFYYKTLIRKAKSQLKSLKYFDKNGDITINGKLLNYLLNEHYKLYPRKMCEPYFDLPIKPIDIDFLIEKLGQFLALSEDEKNDILTKLGNQES